MNEKPIEELIRFDEAALQLAVAALEGLKQCFIESKICTPEYKLYKSILNHSLDFFEATHGEENNKNETTV